MSFNPVSSVDRKHPMPSQYIFILLLLKIELQPGRSGTSLESQQRQVNLCNLGAKLVYR